MAEENTTHSNSKHLEKATFAGGCFWCMEGPFEAQEGVITVTSGYTGGSVEDPTYDQVCSGETGHTEAVQVTFDPQIVSYNTLLEIFWRNIDPTDPTGQFADKGSQYRSEIFYYSEGQKEKALQSKVALEKINKFSKPIVTNITKAAPFYLAEDYHQEYYKKNPMRYQFYKSNSGREKFLKEKWDKEKK